MSRKVYHYEVTGVGTFPIDMLRYDQAWPSSESDAAEIARRCEWEHHRNENVVIRIASYSRPTIARWKSFLWNVSNIQEW